MASVTSKKCPKTKPIARGAGYTLPHIELYRATAQFLTDARRVVDIENEASKRLRKSLRINSTVLGGNALIQHYSMAVQVFAAMTVEAALNTYGIARFEQQDFEKCFRRGPIKQRFQKMIECAGLPPLADDSESIVILEQIMRRRHAFAHYQCDERIYVDGYGYGEPKTNDLEGQLYKWPSASLGTAQTAFSEMNRFLELFRELDPEIAWLLCI